MAKPMPKKLAQAKRRAVRVTQPAVDCHPLTEGQNLPIVIQPTGDCDLLSWAQAERSKIQALLAEHRALLFRGFGFQPSQFEGLVDATSTGERLVYRDRSTPRQDRGDRVYTSTVYPAEHTIKQHNEGTYWRQWAQKLYFYCTQAPQTGGATPIADVQKVLARLDPKIVAEFDERRVMYVRNYNGGLGLKWQDVFQTDSVSELEAYCADNRIEVEWRDGGRLRTRQRRPAVRVHPVTGDRVWFNHAAFFNVAALEPDIRAAMVAQVAEDELPYNTFFGDGGGISADVVETILEAYEAEKMRFDWQVGDVMLVDNMYVSHGREPYSGAREILVAMTEPISDSSS